VNYIHTLTFKNSAFISQRIYTFRMKLKITSIKRLTFSLDTLCITNLLPRPFQLCHTWDQYLNPDNGGSIFTWKDGNNLQNYTVSQPEYCTDFNVVAASLENHCHVFVELHGRTPYWEAVFQPNEHVIPWFYFWNYAYADVSTKRYGYHTTTFRNVPCTILHVRRG
jgi:hypothetical protein